MIKSVYKICSACLGEGVVESMAHPNTALEGTQKITTVTCIACEGRGYVPTGFFVFEDSTQMGPRYKESFRFETLLNSVPEKERTAIKRKL